MAHSRLKSGQLVFVKKVMNPFLTEHELAPGTIGLFVRYPRGSKQFLTGMEPVVVLFEGALVTVYADEIEVVV